MYCTDTAHDVLTIQFFVVLRCWLAGWLAVYVLCLLYVTRLQVVLCLDITVLCTIRFLFRCGIPKVLEQARPPLLSWACHNSKQNDKEVGKVRATLHMIIDKEHWGSCSESEPTSTDRRCTLFEENFACACTTFIGLCRVNKLNFFTITWKAKNPLKAITVM